MTHLCFRPVRFTLALLTVFALTTISFADDNKPAEPEKNVAEPEKPTAEPEKTAEEPEKPAVDYSREAQMKLPAERRWKGEGSMLRPRPEVITPPTASTQDRPGTPPSDAIVLFDGKDLSKWQQRYAKEFREPKWKVENGYFEVVKNTGSIYAKEQFGSCQIHIEWCAPADFDPQRDNGQGRGNSGVFIGGFGELQILDSYENDTYPHGQAGGMYHRLPPLVNACRKPGEWQSYDILIELARRTEDGQNNRDAVMTVLHNGVVIHHALNYGGRRGPITLGLQDHYRPVRFRNIWVRPIKDYDEDATDPPGE